MSENLALYLKLKDVPPEAQKEIKGGRLSGFTDINPMWRFKRLTEVFGAVGFGWYYKITEKWLETVGDETKCFIKVDLFVKMDGEWSQAIEGLGGSSFATKEKSGIYVNDECYKMALTDAIGTAAKALGLGANIYYAKDRSKYDVEPQKQPAKPQPTKPSQPPAQPKETAPAKITKEQAQNLFKFINQKGIDTNTAKAVLAVFGFKGSADITVDKYEAVFDELCKHIEGGDNQ